MSFSPVADIAFNKLTDIEPGFLREKGIGLLLLDIDNTVSPYSLDEPTKEVVSWVEKMKNGGVELFFVSNNRGERPRMFSEKLGIPYVKKAAKPFRKGVLKALEICGKKAEETALCGDQSFTDVLCANGCGITSILVQPIDLSNPLLALRYFAELPFRKAAKTDFREK